MDAYAQALAILDAHYPHIEAWERIVLSYRIIRFHEAHVQIGNIEELIKNPLILDAYVQTVQEWWLKRLLEGKP